MRRLMGRRSIVVVLMAALALQLGGGAVAHAATQANRPREFIAYAQLAVVRLTVEYYAVTQSAGQTNLDPVTTQCTGLGTIIATTGSSGGNAHSFILTDSRLVSPVTPCSGVVAAYLNANKTPPTSWKIYQITAYLNTAYTGAGSDQVGTVSVSLDTTVITNLGLSDSPIVLPVTQDKPYDLPVMGIAQTQSTQATQIIDLGHSQPFTQDALAPPQVNETLDPIESSAASPPPATAGPSPTPVPTATPAATGTPAATSVPTATATSVPATQTLPISLGAPIIADQGNGFGSLAGMVVMSDNGETVVGTDSIKTAIQQALAIPNAGEFDQRWHAGLDDYYRASPTNSNDPAYRAAAQQFTDLQNNYPDFHGVAPWLSAARAGSPDLGASAKGSGSGDIIPGIPISNRQELIVIFAAATILLLGIVFWGLAVRGNRRRQRKIARDEAEDREATAMVSAAINGADMDEQRVDPETLPPNVRALTLRPTTPLPRNRRKLRLSFQAAAKTHPGVRRRESPNQDNILAVQGARLHEGNPQAFGLFVVADGMGGHSFGREASSRAIEVMADDILQPLLDGQPLTDDQMLAILKTGAEHANAELHYENLRQHADMGTTVTAALVIGDLAHIINVGDSRTYHLKPDQPLIQITNDHSVVAGLVAAGVIRPEDVYTHPRRNQIYRSLGEREEVQIDTFQVVLQPGDRLLLCSDGLWEMVRDPRIEEILRTTGDPRVATEQFVEEANANGGVDNISAIVVEMTDERSIPSQTGMHYLASPETIKRK